jgi:hypothetical protein
MKLALAFLLLVSVARAEEPSDKAKEEAAVRFERGIKLYEAQDYAAALAEFEAAYKLVPRYQVLFNVGVTQKRLFRYNDAVRALRRYLDEGGEKVPGDRRELVEKELSEIRALVAEVSVKVDGMPAEVDVDGRMVGESPMSGPLLLAAGHHTVRALRDGYDPAEKAIDVVSGEKVEIALSPKLKTKAPTTAKLTLSSKPNGASMSIDGKFIGVGPWTGTLQPGGHEVRATLKGWENAKQEVVLIAGQERAVTVELLPPTKWYKRWYTWVIPIVLIGGAVAGGVLGYNATHPGPQFLPADYNHTN